jgi:Arc/MetJ family transcription regulator
MDDVDETQRRRITPELPVALLAAAKKEAGTKSAAQAVTLALRELVVSRRRARLLELELPDLTLWSIEELRSP